MERRERDKQQADHAQEQAQQQQPDRQRERVPGAQDFGDVVVHPNGNDGATASQQAFGAQAYTQGNDVQFGAGQHAPGQQDGKQLLAHELSHVVQQQNGKAQE
ncbi:MAG: DUF4157 domain-containing protein [Myxococcales bacterium]|nr:DUF4157 domain-containing protein [Myxococcales bacterium]